MRACRRSHAFAHRRRRSVHTEHNNHLKNNTKNFSLISCFYHVLPGYYSLFVVVRTQTQTCHNLTFFPHKCAKESSVSIFLWFFFFPLYLRSCFRRCFHPRRCHLYNSFFLPNITFQRGFFFLDHKISHISCWKQKIKAHYAESRFQVCDISPIFDVVFTIASQNLHSGYERFRKHQDRTTERVVGGGKKFNSLHSNFNKPSFHGSQVD